MPADVQIHELTGSSSGVDKSGGTVRFKSADETTVNTENRMTIPPSGVNYSYTKQNQFYFNTAPDVDIQNLRAYSDGGDGWGAEFTFQFDVLAAFSSNVNSDIAGTDIFTKDSNSPIDLDSNNTGPHTGTGYKGDILRTQLAVTSSATQGQLAAETITFAYDET